MLRKVQNHHRLMLSFTRALVGAFQRPTAIFLVFLSATISIFGTFGFYTLENGVNQNLHGLLDAFYFCMSTMTGVGYGDIAPVTAAGKLLSIGLMLVGTALYVSFVATVAAALMDFESTSKPHLDPAPTDNG